MIEFKLDSAEIEEGAKHLYKKLPLEEVVDKMLAILSNRNRIMQKHEMEDMNAK